MAVAPALQVRRMMRTKSSRDISTGYFLLLLPGFTLWVAHGLLEHDLALAIPNALSLLTALILLAVVSYYRVHLGDVEMASETDDQIADPPKSGVRLSSKEGL